MWLACGYKSYKYKIKADKSDPEYSISTTGYFESKCRRPSNGGTKGVVLLLFISIKFKLF